MSAARRVAIIAWAELRRGGRGFDRRSRIALLALGVVALAAAPLALDDGLAFDRDLYRVAVEPGAPLAPAVRDAAVFREIGTRDARAAVAAGDADVGLAADGSVVGARGEKGAAALAALEKAAQAYAHRAYLAEPDDAAAFPVRVAVEYEERAGLTTVPTLTPAPGGAATGGDGGGTSAGGDAADAGGDVPSVPTDPTGGGLDLIPQGTSSGTPASLAPPFPFRSLVLSYAFLVPLNFVVQVYAGSMIAERIGRKGEPLLASPARPWEIIAGKTLPYLALSLAIAAGVALAVGGGWLSLLAIVPLALAFLALEFAAAVFARSFRELTFLTVFASVLLTVFSFLPAVFSGVHPVAYISPVSLVVADLSGETPSLAETLYAVVPLTLGAAALFALGGALWTEEDLFHQKPVPRKAVDALARQVRGVASGLRLSFLLLPLVLVAELLLVAFLFAWPFEVGVVGILLAVAIVEEAAKGLPAYAAVARGRLPGSRALLYGAIAGAGFFLAEKGLLLASLVGLYDVPAGALVFGAAPGLGAAGALLLLAPLGLHVVTAMTSAWGAARGRRTFALAFTAAIALHLAYDLAILWLAGAMS